MNHNLDLIKHISHRDTVKFISMMLEKSSFPFITRPTRVTKNSATLIDNIFVNCRLQGQAKSSVIIHDISDHFPSLLLLDNVLSKK